MDVRKDLIANVRAFAQKQGTRNSWDKVATMTDEQISEVLGAKWERGNAA